MICYFSGTGNSRLAATRLADRLGDELLCITPQLRTGERGTVDTQRRPLIIVSPTYAWRLPRVVEHWMRKTRFPGNPKTYFVLTCGAGAGNAAAYAKRLCNALGLIYAGLAQVLMPENFLTMFQTPTEAECRAIIQQAMPVVDDLAERIRTGEPLSTPPVTLPGKLESGPLNPLFYALFVHDRGFYATDACVSCGLCAARCPLTNITLPNGKPAWHGNCTLCMACIAGCPSKAIEYKKKTIGKHRHFMQG